MPSEPLARVGAARGSVCTDSRLLYMRGPAAWWEGRGGLDDAGAEGEHRGCAASCLGGRGARVRKSHLVGTPEKSLEAQVGRAGIA